MKRRFIIGLAIGLAVFLCILPVLATYDEDSKSGYTQNGYAGNARTGIAWGWDSEFNTYITNGETYTTIDDSAGSAEVNGFVDVYCWNDEFVYGTGCSDTPGSANYWQRGEDLTGSSAYGSAIHDVEDRYYDHWSDSTSVDARP